MYKAQKFPVEKGGMTEGEADVDLKIGNGWYQITFFVFSIKVSVCDSLVAGFDKITKFLSENHTTIALLRLAPVPLSL